MLCCVMCEKIKIKNVDNKNDQATKIAYTFFYAILPNIGFKFLYQTVFVFSQSAQVLYFLLELTDRRPH